MNTADNASANQVLYGNEMYTYSLIAMKENAGVTAGLEHHSFTSVTPLDSIAKVASRSGRLGEHTILTTLASPLPFLSARRVVEACAMMLPPMGFTPPPAGNMPPPPSRLAATT
jgi:hypothetical protein